MYGLVCQGNSQAGGHLLKCADQMGRSLLFRGGVNPQRLKPGSSLWAVFGAARSRALSGRSQGRSQRRTDECVRPYTGRVEIKSAWVRGENRPLLRMRRKGSFDFATASLREVVAALDCITTLARRE